MKTFYKNILLLIAALLLVGIPMSASADRSEHFTWNVEGKTKGYFFYDRMGGGIQASGGLYKMKPAHLLMY
ncbi:MAG TPA: hypothetical protein VKR58_08585 [Aquella sp.]|nr:hypothetical protein [Aquella sp.]